MVAENMTPKELLESVEEHLHPGAYTKEEIMVSDFVPFFDENYLDW